MSFGGVVLPSVYIEIAHVPISTVSTHPHFKATLYRLHWKVLLHRRAPFVLNHGLIDTVLLVRLIIGQEGLTHCIDDWTYFGQPIKSGFTPVDNAVIVGKMEETLDLKEALSGNPRCHRDVMECFICRPVVVEVRELVHSHQNGEPKVSLHLISVCLPLRDRTIASVAGTKAKRGIPIRLQDNVVDQLRRKKCEKHLSGIRAGGEGWANLLVKWLDYYLTRYI